MGIFCVRRKRRGRSWPLKGKMKIRGQEKVAWSWPGRWQQCTFSFQTVGRLCNTAMTPCVFLLVGYFPNENCTPIHKKDFSKFFPSRLDRILKEIVGESRYMLHLLRPPFCWPNKFLPFRRAGKNQLKAKIILHGEQLTDLESLSSMAMTWWTVGWACSLQFNSIWAQF